MNSITQKIILGAIATTTIASFPTTAKAQHYSDYGYQGQPSQELQNLGFDSYVGVDEMKRHTIEKNWVEELPNCYGCPGCAGCDDDFYSIIELY